MKKFFLLIGFAASVLGVQAQSRKHIGNFSQFGQYYNPALTGQQGSIVKSFYRDRWTGFEDAPRTFFISGEINLADVKNHTLLTSGTAEEGEATEEGTAVGVVRQAIGVSVLNDRFGPLRENYFTVNYTTGIQLTETIGLQGGIGIGYNNSRLDKNSVVLNDLGDAGYDNFLYGKERIHRYGVNLGIALTASNYFLGYAVQDLVQGSFSENDYLKDMNAMQHIVQAGFRHGITDQLGVVVNGMYRFDSNEEGLYEAQLKGVYNNFFWASAGYRQDLAYTFGGGIRLKQLNIGYTREVATGKSENVMNSANEIMLSYNLAPVLTSVGKALTIW
ncbi:MAG: PorP/SprF family type IX secretion system membrane protein [Rufibacter sp.]